VSRRRTVADQDIIAAALRAIARVGPSDLTLAEVAREIGLAPATLLQRFGSKRGLLLAVAKASGGGVAECFAQVRAANPSPLAAIFASFDEMTRFCNTPESMAHSLAFLQIDLMDPDFHRIALESARATQDGYRTLVEDAIAARELIPCDAARVARTLQAASSGSMLGWAIVREGSLRDWIRHDIETLLGPLRRSRLARKSVTRRGGPKRPESPPCESSRRRSPRTRCSYRSFRWRLRS